MQLEFFDVPSPCIGICQSDEKGHCLGCMRSRNERQEWKNLSNDEKQKVIKRCVQRKKRKNTQLKVKVAEPSADILPEDNLQPSLLEPLTSNQPSSNSQASSDLDFSEFEL